MTSHVRFLEGYLSSVDAAKGSPQYRYPEDKGLPPCTSSSKMMTTSWLATSRETSHPLVVNPLLDWCDSHREDLLAYPQEFVAIDINKGIVCHSQSNEDITAQLSQLDPSYRAKLLLTHTSLYEGKDVE